ncbi:unnamed protein product [Musa textilis]
MQRMTRRKMNNNINRKGASANGSKERNHLRSRYPPILSSLTLWYILYTLRCNYLVFLIEERDIGQFGWMILEEFTMKSFSHLHFFFFIFCFGSMMIAVVRQSK